MAKSNTKVAKKGQPAKAKPASKEPAITVGSLARDLNMTPKALRVRIRRILGEGKAVVGRGKRYGWSSKSHPEVKRILAEVSPKS